MAAVAEAGVAEAQPLLLPLDVSFAEGHPGWPGEWEDWGPSLYPKMGSSCSTLPFPEPVSGENWPPGDLPGHVGWAATPEPSMVVRAWRWNSDEAAEPELSRARTLAASLAGVKVAPEPDEEKPELLAGTDPFDREPTPSCSPSEDRLLAERPPAHHVYR